MLGKSKLAMEKCETKGFCRKREQAWRSEWNFTIQIDSLRMPRENNNFTDNEVIRQMDEVVLYARTVLSAALVSFCLSV